MASGLRGDLKAIRFGVEIRSIVRCVFIRARADAFRAPVRARYADLVLGFPPSLCGRLDPEASAHTGEAVRLPRIGSENSFALDRTVPLMVLLSKARAQK